jgi:hypothetical protein
MTIYVSSISTVLHAYVCLVYKLTPFGALEQSQYEQ